MIENTSSRGYSANQDECRKSAVAPPKSSAVPTGIPERTGRNWGQTRLKIEQAENLEVSECLERITDDTDTQ